ncbi:MAG TPA: hypothetical protein VNJ51_03400 [Candidatus Dormibacteraeota bacterium]|nr:hypothetical protein [Candidatus Dormibacteraeota bacterium]
MRLELFGMARHLVGTAALEVPVTSPVTVGRLLREAARAAPQLVGSVLEADGTPIAPNYLLLDGRRAAEPGATVRESDRPCLLVLASGG